MRHATATRSHRAGTYELDTLHALPCGCVAAIYRAQPLDTEVVSLEARGPHCVYSHHEAGSVLGLSTTDDHRLSR